MPPPPAPPAPQERDAARRRLLLSRVGRPVPRSTASDSPGASPKPRGEGLPRKTREEEGRERPCYGQVTGAFPPGGEGGDAAGNFSDLQSHAFSASVLVNSTGSSQVRRQAARGGGIHSRPQRTAEPAGGAGLAVMGRRFANSAHAVRTPSHRPAPPPPSPPSPIFTPHRNPVQCRANHKRTLENYTG